MRLFMLATKPASICFIIEVQKIKPGIHEQWNVYLIITWSVSSTKYQPLQHDAKKKKNYKHICHTLIDHLTTVTKNNVTILIISTIAKNVELV